MFRRTAALAALALAASLAATVISPAQAADPMLVVPDSPSGDVSVTATADPAVAPFLAVRLIRGTAPTAPYSGIDPAPVANAGGTVEVTVPTWGLHQSQSTFVLLGCATAEPETCTSRLASQTRLVIQTVMPSMTVELPEIRPIFLPEDEVYVTAANDGGGRVEAHLSVWNEPASHQRLDPGVRTLYTAAPTGSGGGSKLALRRCADVADVSYCEPSVSGTGFNLAGDPEIQSMTSGRDAMPFTVNPSWSGSSRAYESYVSSPFLLHDLSWELRDSAGALRAGPVQVVDNSQSSARTLSVRLGEALAGPLADGDYNLVFTALNGRAGISRTDTLVKPVKIVNNPPDEQASLLSAQRIIRPAHLASPELPSRFPEARFKVRGPSLDGDGPAKLVVRDAKGRVVARSSAWHEHGAIRRDWVATWSGNGLDGLMMRSGTYRAELVLPDSFGRTIVKKLGPIYLESTSYTTRSVWVTPGPARVGAGRLVGACSRARAPGPFGTAGSVGLLSLDRCRNRVGTRDVVQQAFSAKIPLTGPSAHVEAYTVEGGARVDSRGMIRRGINRSPNAQVDCRFPSKSNWSARTSVPFWNRWEYALCDRALPDGDHRGKAIQIRVRVHGGVRLEVQRFRVLLHYRVWRRVA